MTRNDIPNIDIDEEPVDDQQAAMEALANSQKQAEMATAVWRTVALELTSLRNQTPDVPELPYDAEKWYETRIPRTVPFELHQLHRRLDELAGLISMAWSLSAVYADEAARLEIDAAAVTTSGDGA